MLKLIIFSVLQSLCLSGAQICLKFALDKMGNVAWTWAFIRSQLCNWWWLACGIGFGLATWLWMYLLKHYAFSVVYPLSCLAYIFGVVLAMVFLQEAIPWTRWVGIGFVVLGAVFIAQ